MGSININKKIDIITIEEMYEEQTNMKRRIETCL